MVEAWAFASFNPNLPLVPSLKSYPHLMSSQSFGTLSCSGCSPRPAHPWSPSLFFHSLQKDLSPLEVYTVGLQLKSLLNQKQTSRWLLQLSLLAQPWSSSVHLILEYVSLYYYWGRCCSNPSAGDSSEA